MDLLTRREIDALLSAHGLRASRALGQHFLADPNTARKIARLAEVGPGDRVLEIGPGVGSLTLALAETGASVLALERDHHLIPVLRDVTAALENIEIVEGDALHADWGDVLGDGPWAMASNLPYNIATPLIAELLESAPQVQRMLVMVQREVAERLVATPGSRVAGGISVKVAYYAEASLVGRVSPTVFSPRPKVESALVRFVRRPVAPVDVPSPAALFALVRAGFGQRRKTLRRALAGALPDPGASLEAAGIDPRSRAEQLSLEEWARLARVR